ncbi:MAG: succinate dehydrogenase, cytochrome b556 subunit [Alphaproteobacteria bacterium]|nr:succinate dehydrogenase, cytochrome b556 subunit [Alphaproteobacteria bacterium]
MAENPQKPDPAARPLSPHLTIYSWAPTMIVSITHRITGVGLSVGTLILAWWLVAISNGPEVYQDFYAVMATPLGLLVLFGFTWALAFHLLNGIRHLAWDLGHGFKKETARLTALSVIGLSLLIAAALAALIWTGHGGYLQ